MGCRGLSLDYSVGHRDTHGHASRAKIKDAINAISEVLNAVFRHYLNSNTSFDWVSNPNGAEHLLNVLRYGLQGIKKRKERIVSCEYRTEDFQDPDL